MLLITCPACGVTAAETEFHAGGEAHLKREGPGSSDDAFMDYLFHRRNPKGVHLERWRHQYGCGKWLHMARNTATLEVYGVYPADMGAPPPEVRARIAERTGG